MACTSGLHIATPSTDVGIGHLPVSKSFLSRIMTRFCLWQSRFRREDHHQVARLQTTENRVSEASEVTEIVLDEYLATPTALTSLSFSVRSSIRSGAIDMDSALDPGDDYGRVADARANVPESLASSDALGLQGLPQLTMVDVDGVPPARPSPDFMHHTYSLRYAL